MTLLLMTVSACTTPLKRDMPASTVTIPADTSTVLALTVTLAAAVTVMPAGSSLTVLPTILSGATPSRRKPCRAWPTPPAGLSGTPR